MSLIVNPYWYASSGCPDADANAFLTAAGITNPTISGAICTLVTTLKSQGIWSKLDAIYPMVGGTATTHKFNLKNPADTNAAYRLSFVGGWTHSANGALPNGTNAYADTFWLSTQQNSASLSFYSRSNTTGLFHEYGSGVGPLTYLVLRFNNLIYATVNSSSDNNVSNTDSRGFYMISRTASNAVKVYKNASAIITASTASSGIPTYDMIICAWRQFPGTIIRYSNRQCAFATLGTGLNDTEYANLYTAIQTFQTTLGRQV
jgi:hypothetical protein